MNVWNLLVFWYLLQPTATLQAIGWLTKRRHHRPCQRYCQSLIMNLEWQVSFNERSNSDRMVTTTQTRASVEKGFWDFFLKLVGERTIVKEACLQGVSACIPSKSHLHLKYHHWIQKREADPQMALNNGTSN